jgi:hypothetical protein
MHLTLWFEIACSCRDTYTYADVSSFFCEQMYLVIILEQEMFQTLLWVIETLIQYIYVAYQTLVWSKYNIH